MPRPFTPVHQQNIRQPVIIIVQKTAAAAHRFRHPFFAESAVLVDKVEMRCDRDVDEIETGRSLVCCSPRVIQGGISLRIGARCRLIVRTARHEQHEQKKDASHSVKIHQFDPVAW